MEPRRWSSSRIRYGRPANSPNSAPMSMVLTMFISLFVLQIISNTDQARAGLEVVRVVRVDVPMVVPAYNPIAEEKQSPLLLGCAYTLKGGENDDENGDVVLTKRPPMMGTTTPAPEMAMDAAIEEVQRVRGLVVKWYFRRNPVPDNPDDPMAKINDNEQVYQWMAGGDGGPLGALIGHTVDVTDQTPRIDKTALQRIIRVDRPSLDLTGEYRCQVEDWTAERRSAWQPMVVYIPERVFKVLVSDSYDSDDDKDDVDDNNQGPGSDLGIANSSATTTTPRPPVPTTGSSAGASPAKDIPTKINITCYAAGMHPEPSMSIWVNGVMQDDVTIEVTDDDGDNDETNDVKNVTTTTTTTTPKPRVHHWNRYRSQREGEVFRNYTIRASKVVSLKDVEQYRNDDNNRTTERPAGVYRPNTVDVECRMRVPGDGTGDGFWKADRPANRYYGVRKSVAYKYRADPPPPPPPDAFTSVSSASSVSDVDGKDTSTAQSANNAGSGPKPAGIHFIQSMIVAGVAAAARQ